MTALMTRLSPVLPLACLLLAMPVFPQPPASQPAHQGGRGMMNQPGRGRGMMNDPAHDADRQVLLALFDHRSEITRRVTQRPDGIETVTESTNPEVTRLLQAHVSAMLARVKDARPIHQRDPLFAELFRYADRIDAQHQLTPTGVRVVETSGDPYVVKLLQAHAAVVDAFIANGHAEMMKNHSLPER
jgi:hypothetical protein